MTYYCKVGKHYYYYYYYYDDVLIYTHTVSINKLFLFTKLFYHTCTADL